MRKMRSCIMGTQGPWKEGILGTRRDMREKRNCGNDGILDEK